MSIRLGVLMDPIQHIKVHKDSTFAMLLEAQARGWEIHYIEQNDLYLRNDAVYASTSKLQLQDDPSHWFSFTASQEINLSDLDVILMRKDPPFNMQYIYTTYLLEMSGTLVVNHPQALRDANEKLSTAWFPQCCTPTLVSCSMERFNTFIEEQQDVIVKPLDGMGGASIFRIRVDDPNRNVILENMTNHGKHFIMAQRYIPEIREGDKRILIVNGKPVPYALARVPQEGEHRGNLAAGGEGIGVPLSERDWWICNQLTDELTQRGILFAGIDVIGDYLTEINITSPTCIRELDKIYDLNISAMLMDSIEEKITQTNQSASL
ncbi:MAG: glutathione synthase [Gammaproteobacteria bacterium]